MSDYSELKRLAEVAITPEESPYLRCTGEFERAATPVVVLELIVEIEALTNRVAGMHEDRIEAVTEIVIQGLEIDQLKAENEALLKDAKRYQWLRDSSESIHQFYLSTPIWFTGVKFSKENVDSTIDAAMGKGEQV